MRGSNQHSPPQHLPGSSEAQPVPVRYPGYGAGSSTPPVLKEHLRDSQEGWEGRASPAHPWAQPGPAVPSLISPASVPVPATPSSAVPSPGAGRDPNVPHAQCPVRWLVQCHPHGARHCPCPPAVPAPCPPPWHSPSPASRTDSPPWPAAARSTAPCARGRAAGPLSPSAHGSGCPLPAAGSAGEQGLVGLPGMGRDGGHRDSCPCQTDAAPVTCQAIRSFSFSMFTPSSGCSCM